MARAEDESGQSRVYLGVHWLFDKTAGIAMGRAIADHVVTNAFRPLDESGDPITPEPASAPPIQADPEAEFVRIDP